MYKKLKLYVLLCKKVLIFGSADPSFVNTNLIQRSAEPFFFSWAWSWADFSLSLIYVSEYSSWVST